MQASIRGQLNLVVFFVIAVPVIFGPIANMFDRDDLARILLLYQFTPAVVSICILAFLLGYTENHSWLAMKKGFWLAFLVLIMSWILIFIVPLVSGQSTLAVQFGPEIVQVNPAVGGLPVAISLSILGAYFSSLQGYVTIVVFLLCGILASRCSIALKQYMYKRRKEELESLARLR